LGGCGLKNDIPGGKIDFLQGSFKEIIVIFHV
jgi:hypothetical protein